MKKMLFICFLLLFASNTNAQITFQKTFGGINDENAISVQQTFDEGYIFTGKTNSFGAGGYDVYLVKTDVNGDTLWTKTYGGGGDDFGIEVRQTTDSGYIISGQTSSFGAGLKDIYLIKTDANGDTLWTKTYGGANEEENKSVQQTTDGGYIIIGLTQSFGAGNWDAYLIKTDANGDTLWTKTYGGTNQDQGQSVQQTADGGYIIGGMTLSFGGGNWDVYLVKTDNLGNILWTKSIGDNNTVDERGISIQQTTDMGYIITGWFAYTYISLIKTDSTGNVTWSKNYGATASFGSSVQQTSDGGYIVVGESTGIGSATRNVYLIKTDLNGDTLWTRTYAAVIDQNIGFSVQQTSDTGYIITGQTGTGGLYDVYLIKTDSLGNTEGCNEGPTGGAVTIPTTIVNNTATLIGSGGIVKNTSSIVSNTPTIINHLTPSSSFIATATTICEGETINFTNTSISAITYQWLADGILFSTATDTARTFNTTGVFTISLIADSASCSDSSGIVITVNPTYSISDSPLAICSGDSISIYSIFRSIAGTYYDSLTTTNGCDSVHSTTLSINSTYSITDPAIAICDGDSISIYGIFRSIAGTYYDSLTTTNGCDSIYSITLTVNPTFSVNDTVAICNGDSAFLAGIYQMVAGSYIDTNTTVNGCDSIVTTELIVNPTFSVNDTIAICNGDSAFLAGTYQTVAGSYIDTNTTANGCDSIVISELIVYPLPTVNIIGDTIACGSALLDEGLGIPGDTYLWSTTETTQTITVTVSGTYSLTVTGVNGCQGSDSINVTVNPTYSITDPAIDICYGDSVSIYGTFRSVAGTYYNPFTTINGCDSTHSTVLTVVNSTYSTNTPDKSICSGDSVMIFGIYRSVTGTYYDSLTTVNGCDSVIITALTVYVCTGVENLDFINNFKIYPNPNTGEFTLELEIPEFRDIQINITNSLGQELFTEELKQFKGFYEKQLDLNEFPAGIYTLQLLSEKGVINKKIILE